MNDRSPPSEISIRVRPSGPYVVVGPVRILDHQGREFVSPQENTPGKKGIALCRCGHSGQRPFCDGSHRTTGFAAEETAQDI